MTVYWPINVPKRLMSSSEASVMDYAAVFEPEVGPEIATLRTTADIENWNFDFEPYTVAEFILFEAWYKATLKRGTMDFYFNHPITNVLYRWKMRKSQGAYTYKKQGQNIFVSMMVVRLPGAV